MNGSNAGGGGESELMPRPGQNIKNWPDGKNVFFLNGESSLSLPMFAVPFCSTEIRPKCEMSTMHEIL